MRRTKIVCTLGPATDDINILKKLLQSGMDVARFNFSHGGYEDHQKRFDILKKMREELNLPVAALLDTKGPEIRIRTFKDKSIELAEGDEFILTTKDVEGDKTRVSVTYPDLPKELFSGALILIDDGLIELVVTEIRNDEIHCRVNNGGSLSANKSINLPNININMPYLSQKDIDDIKFGIKNKFDYIAASFTRSASDIQDVKQLLEDNGGSNIQIIAKIENREGVDNIDEILRIADGIMIARGDMGVEIPFEELPNIQKKLIKKAYSAGKKVITATQMLESMIKNPRPTRAETTDVANAIYDGTSAIMLSGETAVGKYPVESVLAMSKIAVMTESDINYKKRFEVNPAYSGEPNVTDAISHATCMTAHDLGAKAIITVTKSGSTARMISKYRSNCTIIACTTDETVYRQLNLSWGVTPLIAQEVMTTTDDLIENSVDLAMKQGLLQNGDLVVITAGVPLGISGTTNLLKVHLVGHVLVCGTGLQNKSNIACSKLCVCQNEDEALANFEKGDILVIPETSNKLMPILKKASGIVTEYGGADSHAAIVGATLDIPVVYSALGATKILKSGTTVTIDSSRGMVYCGEL